MTTGRGGMWNRSGRRSGGSRPAAIPVGGLNSADRALLAQLITLREQFGVAGVTLALQRLGATQGPESEALARKLAQSYNLMT